MSERSDSAEPRAPTPVPVSSGASDNAYGAFAEAGPWARTLGPAIVGLAVLSGLATYLILTGLTPIVPRDSVVVVVLVINALLVIAMVAVIARQSAGLWRAWRERVAGARLHIRIVLLFSVIAAIPALLLALAATTTFSRSLEGWFSTRMRQIVANAEEVAQSYLDEHGQLIRLEAVNMARDLDAAAKEADGEPGTGIEKLKAQVLAQGGLRELPYVYVIDTAGTPVISAITSKALPFVAPSEGLIAKAATGHVPLTTGQAGDRIAAVARLERHPGRFLLIARGIAPNVVALLRRSQQNAADYRKLRRARGGLVFAHGLMYLMISLTALFAAIWTGMWFAGRFVAPIRRLIVAAEKVSQGDLKVVLPVRRGEGDLRRLSLTFNTMTSEIKRQRDALVTANTEIEERRRFIEAVLSGVSAGVIGIDGDGTVSLVNRSAERLLGLSEAELVGRPFRASLPDFAVMLDGTEGALRARAPDQLKVGINGEERTLAVRVTHETGDAGDGLVVTFDDITDLVVAQRTSAWGEVARRMAHEIKNPLLPIQLSAERIRRKYGRVIAEDQETFVKLTQTIERQVGHIKGMVDEFAAFARMPKPEIETVDIRESVQEPVILFRESHPRIDYVLDVPGEPVMAACDRRLISQALTNLVKNATEAVESYEQAMGQGGEGGPLPEAGWKGRVETRLARDGERIVIEVIDNGTGLAKQNRARLLEPYVTTKAKGTGLGLAIVQKIVEQHGGTLALEDAPVTPARGDHGAQVRIVLPVAGDGAAGVDAGRDTPAAMSAAE
ncbi:MAG: PAS domain-containing sensor histidine kinase [Hyphomicrobiaceae bacterium]